MLQDPADRGHCGIALDRREYDILAGETRTAAFLDSVNGNGRIPVLQIGDDYLPESNAACVYLAHGSALIPHDRFDHADMLRWMFWEQYNHEPNVATLRFWRRYVGAARMTEAQHGMVPAKDAAAREALALMDRHLGQTDWFAAGRFTLADIALYAYTHVAEEGALPLTPYPNVQAWLDRVAALPGHVALQD